MNNPVTRISPDIIPLVDQLTVQYGPLAMTRAAGEAFAAERRGDNARRLLWHAVVNHLRQSLPTMADAQGNA